MNLSKQLKIFSQFSTALPISTSNFKHFEKTDESPSLCLSKIIDCEILAYENVQRVMFQYTLGQSTC